MSIVREQFDATLEIKVGTTKVMRLIIEDPETGDVVDMSDTDVFNTGKFTIQKSDKTLVGPILDIIYSDRSNGTIEFLVETGDGKTTISENAGNWKGTVQFINVNSLVIDQRDINFNILN